MTLKHNKKKNGRIVYEQLMTLATRLALTEHIDESRYILNIVKEHFASNSMLGKEKKLFDSLLKETVGNREEADAILIEVLTEAKFINEKKLEQEKINLINKIINEVGKDLFSIPVKQFKLLASTQILFNEMRNKFMYSTPKERAKIKNILVENMNKATPEDDLKMDNLTFKILIEKFNKKYSSVMNKDQKEILHEWTNYLLSENKQKFKKFLDNKLLKIKREINRALIKEEHKTSDYFNMLNEAKEQLNQTYSIINEETIHSILKYFDLIEDLREMEDGR